MDAVTSSEAWLQQEWAVAPAGVRSRSVTPLWDLPRTKTEYQRMVQAIIDESASEIREPVGLALSKRGRELWQSGSARHVFKSRSGVKVPMKDWCYNAKAGWDIVGVTGRLNGEGRKRTTQFRIAPSSLSPEGVELYRGFRWFRAAPSTAASLAENFEHGPEPVERIIELYGIAQSLGKEPDEIASHIRRLLR